MREISISMRIALALAVAALLVPAAGATDAAPGKYGPLDPWAYAVIHAHARAVTRASGRPSTSVPEIIAGISPRVAGVKEGTSAPPDVRAHRLVEQLVRADRRSAQSSFDWGAAGIGAGIMLAAVLTVLGGTSLIRRARRGGALTPSKHALGR